MESSPSNTQATTRKGATGVPRIADQSFNLMVILVLRAKSVRAKRSRKKQGSSSIFRLTRMMGSIYTKSLGGIKSEHQYSSVLQSSG